MFSRDYHILSEYRAMKAALPPYLLEEIRLIGTSGFLLQNQDYQIGDLGYCLYSTFYSE